MKDLIAVVVLVVVLAGVLFVASKMPVREEPADTAEENTMTDELKIEILQEGTGEAAKTGDMVSVHYTGSLTNGMVFDSSISRGEAFSFILGQNRVIQGWEQGVLGMKVGEKRRLTIPAELGYGAQGYGPIPGGATLIFEVELTAIVAGATL